MKTIIRIPKIRIQGSNKISLIYVLFVIIEIGTFLFRSSFLFRNIALMAIGLLSIYYSFSRRGIRSNRPFINFVFIYTVCGILSILVNQNSDIQELLWPCAYMGVGLLLLNFQMPFKTVKWTYIIVSIAFAFSIVFAGSVDNLELQASRNTISTYELQLWSIYMIAAYQNKEDAKYWSILLGLFVSVISIGRGGILTFLIMLIIYMLFRYKKGKTKSAGPFRLVIYITILVAGAIIIYSRYSDLINQTIYNFEWRGSDSKRPLIWGDYFSNVKSNPLYLIFGAPQRGSFWLDEYADNLHNSFLELHAKYGLFMVVGMIIALVRRIIFFARRKQMYLLIPLIGLIIRMNLDYTNFNAILDVILIYFLLYPNYKEPILYGEIRL